MLSPLSTVRKTGYLSGLNQGIIICVCWPFRLGNVPLRQDDIGSSPPLQQTFAYSDVAVVGTLTILEGLLSADNALVLALLVRHLSPQDQNRALSLGLLMAFLLRAIGIALAGFIIRLWWLCGIGALYLIFLAVKHFFSAKHNSDYEVSTKSKRRNLNFKQTVTLVGFTDVVFAVDSILVAVAIVDTAKHPDKLWAVYVGGFLGIILLRAAAGVFIQIIRRYPTLDNTAYALVAWAGVKLGFTSAHLYDESFPEMNRYIFWIIFSIIIIFGILYAVIKRNNIELSDDNNEKLDWINDNSEKDEKSLALMRKLCEKDHK